MEFRPRAGQRLAIYIYENDKLKLAKFAAVFMTELSSKARQKKALWFLITASGDEGCGEFCETCFQYLGNLRCDIIESGRNAAELKGVMGTNL